MSAVKWKKRCSTLHCTEYISLDAHQKGFYSHILTILTIGFMSHIQLDIVFKLEFYKFFLGSFSKLIFKWIQFSYELTACESFAIYLLTSRFFCYIGIDWHVYIYPEMDEKVYNSISSGEEMCVGWWRENKISCCKARTMMIKKEKKVCSERESTKVIKSSYIYSYTHLII